MAENKNIKRCKKCGDKACVCCDSFQSGKWAAHCMTCEHSIGKIGYYDPCADSEDEAIKLWNEIN